MVKQEAALAATSLSEGDQEATKQILHQLRERIERSAFIEAVLTYVSIGISALAIIFTPLLLNYAFNFKPFLAPGLPGEPPSYSAGIFYYVFALMLTIFFASLIHGLLVGITRRAFSFYSAIIWVLGAVIAQRLAVATPRQVLAGYRYGFAIEFGALVAVLLCSATFGSTSAIRRAWARRTELQWMSQLPDALTITSILGVHVEAATAWQDLEHRALMIRLLEYGATAMERALSRLMPTADVVTDQWLMSQVGGRVAGVRAIKRLVCLPGPQAREDVMARCNLILTCILQGNWSELPVESFDENQVRSSRIQKAALSCIRAAIALIPLGALALAERLSDSANLKPYFAVAWIWAVVGVVGAFDPEAGKKISLAKEMEDLARTFSASKSGK
jgi:hypothetical protein